MEMTKKEDMRKEYRREDLGGGVRGKYNNEYIKGTNLVLLSLDVAAAFPDDDSVNTALRSLMQLAQRTIAQPSAKHVPSKSRRSVSVVYAAARRTFMARLRDMC